MTPRNQSQRRNRRQQRGVTLIELMTVIVVIAILATVAVPSYRSYLLRSQRSEATRSLLHVQAAEEKYFLQNNRYADHLEAASPDGLGIPALTENGYYDIRLQLSADGSGYTATATPHAGGGQADDGLCRVITVDQTLRKSARDPGGNDVSHDCWR